MTKQKHTPSQLSLIEKAAPDLLDALIAVKEDKKVMSLSLETLSLLVQAISKATVKQPQ